MPVGVDRDLRQVRDAQHLVTLGERAEFFADGRTKAAADVGVDFIEDENADAIALRQNAFEREHDAAELSAGRDLPQRLRRLARIRLDDELDLVEARRRW